MPDSQDFLSRLSGMRRALSREADPASCLEQLERLGEDIHCEPNLWNPIKAWSAPKVPTQCFYFFIFFGFGMKLGQLMGHVQPSHLSSLGPNQKPNTEAQEVKMEVALN